MSRLERMLSRLPNSPIYTLQPNADPALAIPSVNPFFVKPPLREISQPEGPCPILLISSPGAVGKSTLASFIASEKRCYLWDLSRLSLGSNTFVGTIAHSFGASNLGTVLQDLSTGRALFVLDALDEAEVAAGGWSALEMFLREIYSCVHEATNTCVIMLARSETAGIIAYLYDEMADEGPKKYAEYEIDYFDEKPSRGFVASQLDRLCQEKGKQQLHRRHTDPFDRALSLVFGCLQQSLCCDSDDPWHDASVRTFLGYAPVLQAIASYLAPFENFQKVEDDLAGADITARGVGLVCHLMKHLLVREQDKLISGIKRQAIPEARSWTNWNMLYTPEEQLRRVFLHSQGDSAANKCCDDAFPPWLVRPYETAIASFLPQHPFLRERVFAGPAFRDFVIAHLLVSDDMAEQVKAALDAQQYSRFDTSRYISTPLLVQFYVHCGNGSAPGDHAGYLYESALSGHGINARPRMIIVAGRDSSGTATHDLEVFDEAMNDGGDDGTCIPGITISLKVSDEHPVVFPRHVRHALLAIQGKLVIGNPSNECEIMDTEANATSIEVRSPAVILRTHDPSWRIVLQADRCGQMPPMLRVDRHGQGVAMISWPDGNRHPWAPYYVKDLPDESHDSKGAMLALRRILTWFKKDRRSDLARYKLLIDNVAVGHRVLRQQLRDHLCREGILFEDGPLYKIDLARAKQVGINWLDVRHNTPSPELSRFLDRFLSSIK